MKILALNGSHRGQKGYTQFLIDRLFEGASSAGAACESLTLAELDIKRCTGCFTCQIEERLFQCIHDGKDDVKFVFDKMREADLIIFATPVYIFNMSSLLKNLLDRLPATCISNDMRITKSGLFFHHIDRELCSKPFAALICQDNMEYETHRNIIAYFKTYARFMDAKFAGSLVRCSGMAAGHGKDQRAFVQYPVLKDIYGAFHEAGKQLATRGKISAAVRRRANRKLIHIPILVKTLAKLEVLRGIIESKAKVVMKSRMG